MAIDNLGDAVNVMNGITDAVNTLRNRIGELIWAREPIVGDSKDVALFCKIREEAVACEGALDMVCKEYFLDERKRARKRGYDLAFDPTQT